jgi:transposase
MAKERTSIRMQEQIKKMWGEKIPIRKIARALKVSRKTVRKVLGISTPTSGEKTENQKASSAINWEYIRQEVGKGCTIKQIHKETAPQISYVEFWREFRRHTPSTPEVTIKLHHKPGERTHIDFTDGLWVVDPKTGKKTLTQLFVGVLPFSSYTFGEFVLDQKLNTFMSVQERMFSFFGGVTPYVIPDNLKSGVQKAHLYDPDVNPTYCDFSNHMGFAVLPARPYKSKDKASVESANGVIQRGFFQEVRNRIFYSLSELNEAFRNYLHRLNHEVMKDYGVSRATRFEQEKQLLKPLPSNRFQISEWRQAKVHPDCHIQIGKNFYSVPFQFVGKTVRVRLTEKMVEVFDESSQSITCHTRQEGMGKFSTFDSHYPQAKVSVARFEVYHAKEQAKKIGENGQKLIEELLSGEYPLRHLRRVQGILRLILSHQISNTALDYACLQAMQFNKKKIHYIKNCALHFQKHGNKPKIVAPQRDNENLHLRGDERDQEVIHA